MSPIRSIILYASSFGTVILYNSIASDLQKSKSNYLPENSHLFNRFIFNYAQYNVFKLFNFIPAIKQ